MKKDPIKNAEKIRELYQEIDEECLRELDRDDLSKVERDKIIMLRRKNNLEWQEWESHCDKMSYEIGEGAGMVKGVFVGGGAAFLGFLLGHLDNIVKPLVKALKKHEE